MDEDGITGRHEEHILQRTGLPTGSPFHDCVTIMLSQPREVGGPTRTGLFIQPCTTMLQQLEELGLPGAGLQELIYDIELHGACCVIGRYQAVDVGTQCKGKGIVIGVLGQALAQPAGCAGNQASDGHEFQPMAACDIHTMM